MIAINLSSAFHTTRLALPGMRARNWGRIINAVFGAYARGDFDQNTDPNALLQQAEKLR